ncbi:fatty acid oxidation complex subunit alpha FadJ [Psychrobium sp. MM17-31]|uniref:fatty acid oxidation complex subunit alpha FadJ n=1 Tax=Psychrobium sp. MM17-31 TaxID=2917758 RepID=UPI001EF457E8|nr:fatty acid oxidation complex subunit alpha FadJ [Psychrobium sp. MM17-31]MCG7531729.1 fatty acid oxidation complex subunit alpha FadJ [Psychrobium sp. MM17-31]
MSTFTTTINDDNIAIISMDVAGEKMNTLRAEFGEQMTTVLDELEANSALKGVVVISGKPDNFIAGADITMLDSCQSRDDVLSISRMGQQMFDRIENMKVPVVAAINGPCLGGGLELAMACHARVCTDDAKTVLGLPEVQLGLLPGSGGTQRLPALVGVAKSLDMMLTGKQLRAKQAKKAGLVDDVVPKTILLEAALKLASKKVKRAKPKLDKVNALLQATSAGRNLMFNQAEKSVLAKTKGHYPAPLKIIDCVRKGLNESRSKGLEVEASHFADLVMTDESKALRQLFFATTEMKKETGSDAQPEKVNKAMVLGGGLMGGGIANVTAIKANIPTRIKDISHDGISQAFKYSYDLLNKKFKRRFITRAELESKMNNLTGTVDYRGVKDVDIVVEAVFEDLKLKHQMVKDVEEHCGEHTIFASNTSSLPIGKIAEHAARPENVIGLHYFSPVDKMPLVEVIAHETTSAQTIATTVAFAKKQGKTPIVVKDGAGFYVNRILGLYVNEAANVLMEGDSIEALDKALVEFGFPVGPVTLLDEVGIDVGSKISPILEAELGDRFKAPAAFDALLNDDRKGKKNRKGFYRYDKKAKGKKLVDESVYKVLGVTPSKETPSKEIAQRCVIQMLNEATRCLEEGIISNVRDGDIGAIFGIGFPPFLAGPFSYIDKLGVTEVVRLLKDYQAQHGDRFAPSELLLEMSENDKTFY